MNNDSVKITEKEKLQLFKFFKQYLDRVFKDILKESEEKTIAELTKNLKK